MCYFIIDKDLNKLRAFKWALIAGVTTGLIVLFNPYITNIVRYGHIDYPANEKNLANSVNYGNVPANLVHDGRVVLVFYGIFSHATTDSAQDSRSKAGLKLPLSFTGKELHNEASTISNRVGGFGVLYGGALLISVLAFAYLFIKSHGNPQLEKQTYAVSVLLALITATVLLTPTPNLARYVGQLFLVPIVIVIGLLLSTDPKKRYSPEKIMAAVILTVLGLNILNEHNGSYCLRTGHSVK